MQRDRCMFIYPNRAVVFSDKWMIYKQDRHCGFNRRGHGSIPGQGTNPATNEMHKAVHSLCQSYTQIKWEGFVRKGIWNKI